MAETIILEGGPAAGERIKVVDFPEVLRVPITIGPEPLGLYDPPQTTRIAWYRRAWGSRHHYDFAGYERG